MNLSAFTTRLAEIRRIRAELGLITDITDEQLLMHMACIGCDEELKLLRQLREDARPALLREQAA